MTEIHSNNILIDGVPKHVFDVRPEEDVVLGNGIPQEDSTDRGSLRQQKRER